MASLSFGFDDKCSVVPGSIFGLPDLWRNITSTLQDSGAQVYRDEDKFQATVDVQHFKPEEVSVKISPDKVVTIEGKHEEKQDEHGYIYRHFIRKYTLPEICDVNQVESKLSSDGVLSITAPIVGELNNGERTIPIQNTGRPAVHGSRNLGIQNEKECKRNQKMWL